VTAAAGAGARRGGAVEIVVGFTPAGASDRVARAIAPALGDVLGRSVMVANIPGEAGNRAARFVAACEPDGHTLLVGNNGILAANPLLFTDAGYETERDFVPVCLIGVQPSILVVSPGLGVRSLADLFARAASAPQPLVMAVSGHGSAAHLAGELFKARSGVALQEKPFDGAGPALSELSRGGCDLMFATASSVLGHISAGRVTPLAVTSARRMLQLPDIPTMPDQGMPGFEVASWHGLSAPAATPRPMVDVLEDGVRRALRTDAVRTALEALAIDIVGGSSGEFAAHIAAEIPKWAELVAIAGADAGRTR
jgi:tripartite-type tricarboxylate transporter receptor subunit TctC